MTEAVCRYFTAEDGAAGWVSSSVRSKLFLAIVVGLLVRFALIPLLTANYDMTGWAHVVENIRSGNGLYNLPGYYYAPPWGYILGLTSGGWDALIGMDSLGGKSLDAIAVGHYGWYMTSILTSVEFNVLVKLPLVVFDLVVGYLVYWIVDEVTGDKNKAAAGFAAWFLCPFVIAVDSITGQFDVMSVMFALMCVIFAMRGRYVLAGAMFAIAFLAKQFPGFMIFALAAYIYAKDRGGFPDSIRNIARLAAGIAVAGTVILLPAALNGDLGNSFSFLTSRVMYNIGSFFGGFERVGTMIAYAAITAVAALISRRMLSRSADLDRTLLFVLLATFAVVFLYPPAPQYVVLLAPFLVMHIVMSSDRRYIVPFAILSVGTTMFVLGWNFSLLLSAADSGIVSSVGGIMSLVDAMQRPFLGATGMAYVYYGGGVIQWIGIAGLAYLLARDWFKAGKGDAEAAAS